MMIMGKQINLIPHMETHSFQYLPIVVKRSVIPMVKSNRNVEIKMDVEAIGLT